MCTAAKSFSPQFFSFVHSKYEDFGTRNGFGNLGNGLQTIHDRHRKIQNNQIGNEVFCLRDGLEPIDGLATYFETSGF